MFSRFFIDRPIFAGVLSIVIALAGGLAVFQLPLAQYPPVTPPVVQVNCNYPGASAEVVSKTVAEPIEQQVNGVEKMLYMSSQCTNDGSYNLSVTFEQGVNLNLAQVLVQNRVNLALPMLPDVLKKTGVTTRKMSPDVLMSVNLQSPPDARWPRGRYDQLFLSNYAVMKVRDELLRLPGVSDIFISGQRDYSMRIWVDPDRLAARGLTAGDVVAALREQNRQIATGQIGQQPAVPGQQTQITLSTLGRLKEPAQFEDVILRTQPDGRFVRIKDVGHVELGAKSEDVSCSLDGHPSVGIIIFQLPDANALELADRVHARMNQLARDFPPGMIYAIQYDTTPFTRECIQEVVKSLRDAVILVALVVLLFLQNWRSAIIPLVAVPVAIIGTFAVMAVMGFSLNNLTLFGLVLAIGIVVDDAIVVVEAVEHHIENGLAPREATIKAMSQVSGPVIAVGLVLSAVFVPCAFISGITGQFFRQFALTIAVSTVISAFNSLTLSPALSALLLRPRAIEEAKSDVLPLAAYPLLGAWLGYEFLAASIGRLLERLPGSAAQQFAAALPWFGPLAAVMLGGVLAWMLARPANYVLGRAFRWFNVGFNRATESYTRGVGTLLRRSALVLAGFAGLLCLTYFSFTKAPAGFIPMQDKGYLLVNVQLPDAASLQRTEGVMKRIEELSRQTPGVRHTVAVAGQSILLGANAPNFGALYVMLDDFHQRVAAGLSGDEIAHRLQQTLQDEIKDGLVGVFGAPPVDGLGTAGGFKIVIEDRGDNKLQDLQRVGDRIVAQAARLPQLQQLFSSFRADTPWIYLDINRDQAKMRGVSIAELFATLQVYLASLYVNDFNLYGRTWQVNVQAQAAFRKQADDIQQLKIRNALGTMVPVSSIAKVENTSGPVMIYRYNMYQAAPVNGAPARGVASGEAIARMEDVARREMQQFQGLHAEWTELAMLQLQTGNTAMLVFVLAVVLVFLVLAAQYESWSLPLAVILVVPMCLLCSIAGVVVARMDINVFTQIGFVVLVGLACKNAILIVEYAKNQSEAGQPRHAATLAACRLRLRPIMMTSLAFILGVVPLVLSVGAGAEMRRTLGTAVFAGMLGVTLFGIFLTPVFYNVIQAFAEWRAAAAARSATAAPPPPRSLLRRWLWW